MKQSVIKKHIVEIASHLFYTKGYQLTGINEIIEKAGIAKATLYNHFKSKEDICLAYLDYKNTTFLEDLKKFLQKKKEGKEQILSLFDFLAFYFYDKDFNGCWCINMASEIPVENVRIRAAIQNQKKDFIVLIQGLIEQNLKNCSKMEVETLSKQIYLLYESAVAESHLHQEVWPVNVAKGLCDKLIA